MGIFAQKSPQDLRKVIGPARRLSKLLEELEARPTTSRWFVGRSDELRTLVASLVADWKAGRLDSEKTSESIRSYVDSLHHGAARTLRAGMAPSCCRDADPITAG